tara:strand:+ start:399 stop:599 length:201 start_codon:yes stop_codon:yes gene_type:complete
MIHKNYLLPSNFNNGEIGWVHTAEIKEIVNSYQQPKEYSQKNLLFRGGILLLIPELEVASRAKSLT